MHIKLSTVVGVSDSSTELKTEKVSSSRANYSIMFFKSLLMPLQFFNLLNFKLYHSTNVVSHSDVLGKTKGNVESEWCSEIHEFINLIIIFGVF